MGDWTKLRLACVEIKIVAGLGGGAVCQINSSERLALVVVSMVNVRIVRVRVNKSWMLVPMAMR